MKKALAVIFLFCAPVSAGWLDTDQLIRVPITTDASQIDETIPFFPVYLSEMPAEFWSALDTAGDTTGAGVRATTDDGDTEIPIYVVSISTTLEEGMIIIGGDPSASLNTTYYIYAGSTATAYAVTDTYGRNAVFADYSAAYILNSLTDLTGGGANLSATGSPTSGVSTPFEGVTGYSFNGSSQYLEASISPTLPITIFGYAMPDNITTQMRPLSLSGSGVNNHSIEFRGEIDDSLRYYCRANTGGSSIFVSAASAYAASTWYNLATTRNSASSGATVGFKNGASLGSNTTNITSPTLTRFTIGVHVSNSVYGQYLAGDVALAFIDNAAWSANYVSALHNAFNSSTFYTVGTVQEYSSSGVSAGTTGWVLFQTAAQSSSAAMDWSTITNALVDDANAATTVLDESVNIESEYLNLTNPAYGMTIPIGAPSYTVQFRVKRSAQTNAAREINDLTIQFIDETGTRTGDNLADTLTQWPSTATNKDYTVTGITFDGTQFDTDTGLAIRATGIDTNGNTDTNVFAAWINITWTGDDAYGKTRGFFELEK